MNWISWESALGYLLSKDNQLSASDEFSKGCFLPAWLHCEELPGGIRASPQALQMG